MPSGCEENNALPEGFFLSFLQWYHVCSPSENKKAPEARSLINTYNHYAFCTGTFVCEAITEIHSRTVSSEGMARSPMGYGSPTASHLPLPRG